MLRNKLKFLIPLLALTLVLAVACGSEEPAVQQPAETGDGSSPAAVAGQQQSAPLQVASQQQLPSADPENAVLNVVTTSNIVADWIRVVGQDRVQVSSLLPPNADPHTYQPGAQDIARIADADLVISVGLSLEAGWLNELVENAAQDPDAIVEIGSEVDPIDFVEIFDDHQDEKEMAELLGKLLVGDGETGALSVIELDHGEVEQGAYDLGSRAAVASTPPRAVALPSRLPTTPTTPTSLTAACTWMLTKGILTW